MTMSMLGYSKTLFVVYCDPKDKLAYGKALKSLVELRKHFPNNMSNDDTKIPKDKDLYFVISSEPDL